MRFLFFCIVWALDSKLERAKMKKTMQKMAVGLVAVLSLILALSGCGDDKQVEKEAKEKKSEKFQPDSYYENKSVQELESLCENNDLKACHKAGVKHTDISKAIALLEKSCNGGYGMGCIGLASAYKDGIGIGQNTQKAIALYNKAIELGENMGYYGLGRLYKEGKRAKQDYTKAFEYFQKGCEQENNASCFEVGVAYYRGDGVRRDFIKSKEIFESLCEKDYAPGCGMLGVQYELGQGVRQDFTKAKELYGKACDLGSQSGCDDYKKLQQKGY